MHLVADIPSDRNLHRDKLAVEAGMEDLPKLAESSHLRSEAWEVDHLVLRRSRRHVGIFSLVQPCC